jgi:hypothetical protein
MTLPLASFTCVIRSHLALALGLEKLRARGIQLAFAPAPMARWMSGLINVAH